MLVEKPLFGKVILLTGASRGIGRAAAIACAKEGAELIITGRTVGALEEVDDEIKKLGSKSTIVELDSKDLPAIPRLAKAIHDKWGRLDGFIANAGQLGQMSPMPLLPPISQPQPQDQRSSARTPPRLAPPTPQPTQPLPKHSSAASM